MKTLSRDPKKRNRISKAYPTGLLKEMRKKMNTIFNKKTDENFS